MSGLDDDAWRRLVDDLRANPPRPTSYCGRFECEPQWRMDRTFDDHDLWLVRKGQGAGELNGEPVQVGPGTLIIFRPGDRVLMRHDPRRRLSVLAAHFEFDGTEIDHRLPVGPFQLPHPGAVVDGMDRLIRLQQDPHPLCRWESDGLLIMVLTEIYRQQQAAAGAPIRSLDPRLQRVVELLRSDPARRVSLGDAARLAGLSERSFSTRFGRELGVSFRRFRSQVRLERGRILLLETDLSVSQVARALGYPDAFGFSRQFRSFFGEPPSALRR